MRGSSKAKEGGILYLPIQNNERFLKEWIIYSRYELPQSPKSEVHCSQRQLRPRGKL
ncbi:hypothetical protein PISMIDRAFT_678280 [Pisolithus microcarpus 441]|uniref:Uncharacterized protein n=1 Tax=Pisolithus microcarpus 441 TaxID=765257 RepID=A0A0C9ZES3_9AGAM|nr:hypothetical protein PISMIDRAFT_678280 [Pisolithus microcarpus 441]